MIKKLVIGLGLIVVLAAIGIYALTSNLDQLVKTAVEEGGSRIAQVPVRLDRASIDLTNARGGLFGLTVANPPGFKSLRALSFGAIGLELGEGSTSDLLVINKVVIDKPEITYEIGNETTNVNVLKRNISQFAALAGDGAGGGAGSGKSATAGSAPDDGFKILINHLYITNATVNVSASLMLGKTLSTPLADIHLRDIGKKQGGATAREVAEMIVSAISKNANAAVGKLDLSKIGVTNLDFMGGGVASTLEKVGSGARGILEKGAEGVGSVIKGIFGN